MNSLHFTYFHFKVQKSGETILDSPPNNHSYRVYLEALPLPPPTFQFSSVQSLNRVQFLQPMDHSTPGLPVHHQLPEFTQTHVHRVSDAIQPSHPLSSLSPAPNPSQHQSLFQ